MIAGTAVAVLVLAGMSALIAPILYLTYLSYVDESHSPRADRAQPDPAD